MMIPLDYRIVVNLKYGSPTILGLMVFQGYAIFDGVYT